MRVHAVQHGEIDDGLIEDIARRFTGQDYLFMCPFPRWIRRRLRMLRTRILADQSSGTGDSERRKSGGAV